MMKLSFPITVIKKIYFILNQIIYSLNIFLIFKNKKHNWETSLNKLLFPYNTGLIVKY